MKALFCGALAGRDKKTPTLTLLFALSHSTKYSRSELDDKSDNVKFMWRRREGKIDRE
jgi:hypothetical protein